jgi:hypothetical protein
MSFAGFDLLAERSLSKDALVEALSQCFGVSAQKVFVADDIEDVVSAGGAELVCVRSAVRGEFREYLSITMRPRPEPVDGKLGFLRRLADRLQSGLLMPEDGVDPFRVWYMASGAQAGVRASLAPGPLDHDEYVLEKTPSRKR